MHHKILVHAARRFTRLIKLKNLPKTFIYDSKYLQQFGLQTSLISSKPDSHLPIIAAQKCFATYAGREIFFEEVLVFTRNKDVTIIDVRDPDQVNKTGTIPGSINIPLSKLKQAFNMPDNKFLEKYGRKKPNENKVIIFSCNSGNRSRKAQIFFEDLGYKNVLNYSGGWREWAKKSKNK